MSSVSSPPAQPRVRRRGLLLPAILALALALGSALGATRVPVKQLSDREDRVIISVPRTWSDDTRPDAGRWVDQGAGPRRVPDLATSPALALPEQYVTVTVEPRDRELAQRHAAEVDPRCGWAACLDRGQPVAVEVNGRPGLEQVLSHAGAEWTVLLTLESENYLVTAAGHAGEFTGPRDVEALRTVLHTLVLTS